MRRWPIGLLFLGGCTVINRSDLRERTDRDVDGVPLTADCNDDYVHAPEDPGIVTLTNVTTLLEATGLPACAELTCDGEPVPCRLPDSERRLLDVSLCPDPGDPSSVLRYGDQSRVHLLPIDATGDVQVSLTFENGDAASFLLVDDEDAPPEIALMANRGRSCGLDTCTLAYPLRAGQDETDEQAPRDPQRASVWFTAQAGEDWYIVVSGPGRAAYTLTAVCP